MADDTEPTMAFSPTLLVVSGLTKGTTIPIPLGELLLGREASPAGGLGGDNLLSRRHARITRDDHGRLILEDLGSTNGTLLNGRRVTGPHRIHVSDIIEVGSSKLQVLDGISTRGAAQDMTPSDLAEDESPSGAWLGLGEEDAAVPEALLVPPSVDTGRVISGPTPAKERLGSSSARHEPRRGRTSVQGQVRGIQQRSESFGEGGSMTIWTFRIERYDPSGNRLPPIPVQMRGISFEGSLSEGDEVRIFGSWKNGTLHTERVENVTTGATVKTKSFKKAILVFAAFALIILAGFIAFAVYSERTFDKQNSESYEEFCQDAEELGPAPPGC